MLRSSLRYESFTFKDAKSHLTFLFDWKKFQKGFEPFPVFSSSARLFTNCLRAELHSFFT